MQRDVHLVPPGEQPACGGWPGSCLSVSPLHLGIGFPESHRGGGLCGQNVGHEDSKGLVRGLLCEKDGFHRVLGRTYLEIAFACPERGHSCSAGLAFSREAPCP